MAVAVGVSSWCVRVMGMSRSMIDIVASSMAVHFSI
jgi:hypothetical protein